MKKIMMALMLCLVSIAGFANEQEESKPMSEEENPPVAADEVEADTEVTTYKTFDENGNIIIVTPAGTFNLQGEPIK